MIQQKHTLIVNMDPSMTHFFNNFGDYDEATITISVADLFKIDYLSKAELPPLPEEGLSSTSENSFPPKDHPKPSVPNVPPKATPKATHTIFSTYQSSLFI